MDYLVPDSIEPIRGWRSWEINYEHGLLVSSTNNTLWPAREPLRAKCAMHRDSFEWVREPGVETMTDVQAWQVIIGDEEILDWDYPSYENIPFVGTDAFIYVVHEFYLPNGANIPIRPRDDPDDGRGWILCKDESLIGHFSPNEGCSCGIYFRKAMTMEYVSRNSLEVFGEVSGWGHAIPASRGARVEFAYPQKLYLLCNDDSVPMYEISDMAMLLQKNYGVPVIYDQKRVNDVLDEEIKRSKDINSMILRGLPNQVVASAIRQKQRRELRWIPWVFISLAAVNLSLFEITDNIFNAISAVLVAIASAIMLLIPRMW